MERLDRILAPKIYLAGPEVFLPEPMQAGVAKKTICARYGLDGQFPLDAEIDLSGFDLLEAGYAIYRANEKVLDDCDALIANLTPFRGPGMDAGTAFEIGYMRARGGPVFGYTNDGRLYFDRVEAYDQHGLKRRSKSLPGMIFEDSEQLGVEDFGFVDNLMIDAAIHECGGKIIRRQTGGGGVFTDLDAFEDCVRQVAALFFVNVAG